MSEQVIHKRHIYLKEKRPSNLNILQKYRIKKEGQSRLHPFGCFMYTIELFPENQKKFYNNSDLLLRFRVSVCQPEDQFNYKKAVELVEQKFITPEIKYIDTGANIKLEAIDFTLQITGIKDLYRTLILQDDFKKFAYNRFSTDDMYPKFLKNIRYFNNKVLPEWIKKGYVK